MHYPAVSGRLWRILDVLLNMLVIFQLLYLINTCRWCKALSAPDGCGAYWRTFWRGGFWIHTDVADKTLLHLHITNVCWIEIPKLNVRLIMINMSESARLLATCIIKYINNNYASKYLSRIATDNRADRFLNTCLNIMLFEQWKIII